MPLPPGSPNAKLDVLVREYDHVSEGLRSLNLFGEKLLGLGLALMTIGFSFGLKEKLTDILVFQPIVLSAVLIYAAHIYAELRATGGYKKYLEEAINHEIGENILLGEGFLAVSRHRAIGQKFMYFFYLVLYVVTIHTSLTAAWHSYRLSTFLIISFVVGALLLGAIVSWVEMYGALNSSYLVAKQAATLNAGDRSQEIATSSKTKVQRRKVRS